MNSEEPHQHSSRHRRIPLALVLLLVVGVSVVSQDRVRIYTGLLRIRLVPLYESSHPNIGQMKIVEELEQTVSDKHALAEALLGVEEGAMVGEGMIMLVKYRHPAADPLLADQIDDKRFNNWLMFNDELARDCMTARTLRAKSWRSPAEEALLAELVGCYGF